jgi:hypothetical protein
MGNVSWIVEVVKAGVVPDGPQKSDGNRHGVLGPVQCPQRGYRSALSLLVAAPPPDSSGFKATPCSVT